MAWLLELLHFSVSNQGVEGGCDAHLAPSHVFDKLSCHPCPFLWAPLLVPLTLPESVGGEIVEYKHRWREGDRLLGHGAICDEVGILPSKAEHPCCRLSSYTIQQ